MINNETETETPTLIDVRDELCCLKRRMRVLADALGNETCSAEDCGMFVDDLLAKDIKVIGGMLEVISEAENQPMAKKV